MDIKDIKFEKLEKNSLYHVIVENGTEDDIKIVANCFHTYSEENNLGLHELVTDQRIKFIKIDKDKTYIVEADEATDDQVNEIINILKQGVFKDVEFKVTNLHVIKE